MVASATPEAYRLTLDLLLRSEEVDSVMVVATPPLGVDPQEVAASVVRAVDQSGSGKPIVAALMGADPSLRLRGERGTIPVFRYPETAARALAHAWRYGSWRSRPRAEPPRLDGLDPNAARRLITEGGPGEWITGARAMAVLETYGIPALRTEEASDAQEAASSATRVGFPVALKAAGPGLVHKTDVGGVKLGLSTEHEVSDAFVLMRRSLGAAMSGVTVQPVATPGVETIAGFVSDPAFGPLILLGTGGTSAELLRDHATRLAPLNELDVSEMIAELRTSQLLTGYRGSTPVDLAALTDVVLRLSRLAEDIPELVEADCNPIIASASGVTVVDARFRVGDPGNGLELGVRQLRRQPPRSSD